MTTIRAIQDATAAYFSVSVIDLKSHRRDSRSTRARHVAMYLCRELTEHSLPAIGREFGWRDHTSVIYAVRAVERELRGLAA